MVKVKQCKIYVTKTDPFLREANSFVLPVSVLWYLARREQNKWTTTPCSRQANVRKASLCVCALLIKQELLISCPRHVLSLVLESLLGFLMLRRFISKSHQFLGLTFTHTHQLSV